MRSSLRLASIFVMLSGAATSAIGCGGSGGAAQEPLDAEQPDTSSTDTAVTEVSVDASLPDTSVEEVAVDTGVDTEPADAGSPDTGPPDTGAVDTGPADTGPADTGTPDTGPADTGSPDTGPPDTGPPDTGPADTGPADTGPPCIVGGACDDGNACTLGETYGATCACGGGTPLGCDDVNACTTDSCDKALGCKHVNLPNGTSCGAGKKCNATSPTATSFCETVCVPGSACDDGDACTTGERLDDACACTGGSAVSCDDGNVCTADSCSPASGCVNAALPEGASCATGKVCKAGGCVDPAALLPTITIVTPTTGQKSSFSTSATCQGMNVQVSYTAPNGYASMRWRFIVPSSTNVGGLKTCSGLPAYGYFMDPVAYASNTSGTFTENVSLAGDYTGAAGSGRWWWCVAPGSTTPLATSLVSLTQATSTPPGPPGGAYSTLSNYCYYKGLPPDTATTAQWTLEVTLSDKAGNTVTATRKFWLYQL